MVTSTAYCFVSLKYHRTARSAPFCTLRGTDHAASSPFLHFLPVSHFLHFLPQTAKRELGGGCGLAQVLAVTS